MSTPQERIISLLEVIRQYRDYLAEIDQRQRLFDDLKVSVAKFLEIARQLQRQEEQDEQI